MNDACLRIVLSSRMAGDWDQALPVEPRVCHPLDAHDDDGGSVNELDNQAP